MKQMFSKIGVPLAVAACLSAAAFSGTVAQAAGAETHVEDIDFSFEGPFGKFDTLQLQRGLKIYAEVCAACHGLQYVALRTLGDEGGPELPEDQVRAFSSQYEIFDPELDYLTETGVEVVALASNSVSVQMQAIRAGAGVGIVHDFAIPFAPGLRRILTQQISLTRSFWLIRHADDRRSARMNRLADALMGAVRAEVARVVLEAGVPVTRGAADILDGAGLLEAGGPADFRLGVRQVGVKVLIRAG